MGLHQDLVFYRFPQLLRISDMGVKPALDKVHVQLGPAVRPQVEGGIIYAWGGMVGKEVLARVPGPG